MAHEALIYKSRIAVPYTWSAGIVGTKFFMALRERKEFLATKCPSCAKVFLPPLKTCGACFKGCGEWVRVGPRGTLLSFTQALYKTAAHPVEQPLYGLIKLDGTDTAFLHLLGGMTFKDLKVGMRLEPLFSDGGSSVRWGIEYFRPARGA